MDARPMLLTLRKINGSTIQFVLSKANEDGSAGEILAESQGTLSDKRKRDWAVKCGVPLATLSTWILAIMSQPATTDTKPHTDHEVPGSPEVLPPAEREPEPFVVRLRGIRQTAQDARLFVGVDPVEVLGRALACRDFATANPVVEWDDAARLAALDVDYHGQPFNSRLNNDHLHARAADIQPAPCFRHVSHGRGMKMYYAGAHGFTAEELAAAAGLAWTFKDAQATVEVKTSARHPLYVRSNPSGFAHSTRDYDAAPGEVLAGTGTVDIAAVAAFFQRETGVEAVEDYLAERGLERGKKYTHAHCAIAPEVACDRGDSPVLVGDHGIYCHKCEGGGRTRHRGKPGFVSYAQLIGASTNVMRPMVKHLCHWPHACAVLQHAFGPAIRENVLRPAYSAVLKAVHGVDNPGVGAAMSAARDIVRMHGGFWGKLAGNKLEKSAVAIVGSMPATWKIERGASGEWESKILATEVEQFTKVQGADLTDRGYPPITVLRGARVYGEKLSYTNDRIVHTRPAEEFIETLGGARAPRYVSASKRLSVLEARAHVEITFPLIDWNYLYMLLVAKGFSEGDATQCPFILAHGVSGSGKSAICHVAASILGDIATEVIWTKDTARFHQAVKNGTDKGSFVVFNELFKEADRVKVNSRAALDPLLNMNEDATGHEMYVGPVKLGKTPVIVVTDVELPVDVGNDTQLGRRFINCQLAAHRHTWERSLAGQGRPAKYRLFSDENAKACDAILSDVIDRFFSCVSTMEDCALELGYRTIDKSPEFADRDNGVRRFYSLFLDAPTAGGSDAPSGPGYKCISVTGTNTLSDAWRNICTDRVSKPYDSRALRERDLCAILGVPTAAKGIAVDIVPRDGAVYVRFRMGEADALEWVNGQKVETSSFFV